jgi:predicted nucleic acid-binding protein
MNGRFFLDTNVFVHSFDAVETVKARRAGKLIRDAVSTGKGVVSYQVVQEFFNVALRKFARPMTPAEAEQYLATVFRPLVAVESSPALFMEALRVTSRYRLSWHDSLIVAAAIQANCSTLLSEDLQPGLRVGDLRVENPFPPAKT